MYPTKVKDVIRHNETTNLKFSYEQGLELADKVQDYLTKTKAILIYGADEISGSCIKAWPMANSWVYHLNDTTVIVEMRPLQRCYTRSEGMAVRFATAGKYAKTVLGDLQSILNQHK